MIRKYTPEDRLPLCEFFSSIIEEHKEYISHGELQMGVATDPGILAPDYKAKWLNYLDRQTASSRNTILLYEEADKVIGFVIFGVQDDGGIPYGMIFDMGVSPAYRGHHIGEQLLNTAVDSLKEQGIRDCYLESGVNNHSAHHFFQAHGFSQVSDIFRLKL